MPLVLLVVAAAVVPPAVSRFVKHRRAFAKTHPANKTSTKRRIERPDA